MHIIDVRKLTNVTDYFVICTGTSANHVKTIHDAVNDGMLPGSKPWNVEGLDSMKWILIDFVDTVIHIFQPEQRDFYSLERLWAEGKLEMVEDQLTSD